MSNDRSDNNDDDGVIGGMGSRRDPYLDWGIPDDWDGGEAAMYEALGRELESDRRRVRDEHPGAELTALLERLTERKGELAGYDLVECLGAVRRQVNHLEALGLALMNELGYCPDQGYRFEDMLRAKHRVPVDAARLPERHHKGAGAIDAHLGWGPAKARTYDSTAFLLAEWFPRTLAVLGAGDIDSDTAKTIADRLSLVSDPGLRGDAEAAVLTWLKGALWNVERLNARIVGYRVDRIMTAIDPDAAAKRHRERVRRRHVQLVPDVDSVADLGIYNLSGETAAEIYHRLDAIARAVKRRGDGRALGQLRADIAVSLLLGESHYERSDDETTATPTNTPAPANTPATDTPTPGNTPATADTPAPTKSPAPVAVGEVRVRAKNILHVSLTELLGLYDLGKTDPAVLGGYGPVITEVAERVLAHHLDNPDAEYAIVVTHPRTGRPIQYHPVNARLFGGRLRDAATTRWPTCTWPGCTRPAEMCQLDHSHDYAAGGATSLDNAGPECDAHHWQKTKHGWRHERDSGELITWVSPFGHSYPVPAPAYTDPDLDAESGPEQANKPAPDTADPGPRTSPEVKKHTKVTGPPPF